MGDKKPRTLVTFLLDMTGSMWRFRDTTLSAVNEYIDSLREQKRTRFSLSVFNSEITKALYGCVKLSRVKEITTKEYTPDHWTPLYDAIAGVVKSAEAKESKYDRVLCVIMTDGLENASKEWTFKKIVGLIEKKKSEGWTFVYLGSNQDAWAVGTSLGIPGGNTLNYAQGSESVAVCMAMGGTRSYMASTDTKSATSFFERDEEKDGDVV